MGLNTRHDSTACTTTLNSDIYCMLSVSHVVVEEFGHLLFTALLQFIEV